MNPWKNRLGNLFPATRERHPVTALEERQALLAHHVRLVAGGLTNGLFVYGAKGGLGKSKTVLETLAAEGVQPVILNGHVTPLALYSNLFSHQDRIIFVDDADGLYRNLPALGILRSALWGAVGGKRLVTYNSSQIDLPRSFLFCGRMILTANNLPRNNPAFDAVLSRIDTFELSATNEEVLEVMRCLATQGFETLSAVQCLEVVEFIAANGSTRDLSLRLLHPSLRKYQYAQLTGADWRELIRTQLHKLGTLDDVQTGSTSRADDLRILRQAIERFPNSVSQQVEFWTTATRKSRATFFRLKKSLGDDHQPPSNDPSLN